MRRIILVIAMCIFALCSLFAEGTNRYEVVAWHEDFEGDISGWTHYDGTQSPNNWHVYNNNDTQGNVWWMGDPSLSSGANIGGYHDSQYLVLDTPARILNAENATLTFKVRYNVEAVSGATSPYNGWDACNVRISDDNGLTWTPISGSPAYNMTSSYAFGFEHEEGTNIPGWGGSQLDWVTANFNLSAYIGASVMIRFAFASDPNYSTGDAPSLFGLMVDDISFGGYSNNGIVDGQMSWSSMVPLGGDIWNLGTDIYAPSPNHVMKCQNAQGTYNSNMLNYLVSPSITLPSFGDIRVDFQIAGGFMDGDAFPEVDYFGWEISVNNGVTWNAMSNPYGSPTGANYIYISIPLVWSSMVGTNSSLDGYISDYSGQSVRFRWYFKSDSDAPSGNGIMIDDVKIYNDTFVTAQTLFFSEYIEGTTNNKALEIFNGTGSSVDLSQYTIKLASNGGTWSTTNIITPSGILENNDVYVIANAGANATILAQADVTSTVTYFNGDDCVGLFHGDVLIDIIGSYLSDPGTAWDVAGVTGATLNHTLIRKTYVTQGNSDWAASSGSSAESSEWIVMQQNYTANLGYHNFNHVSEPLISHSSGVYTSPITITLTCSTPNASIFYTLDGTTPAADSQQYSGPILVAVNSTVKAFATADGMVNSTVSVGEFSFLIASFTATEVSGLAPLSVNFVDLSYAGSGSIENWFWVFGDGEYASIQNPSHIYSNVGVYTVSLTIINSNDLSSTCIFESYIQVLEPVYLVQLVSSPSIDFGSIYIEEQSEYSSITLLNAGNTDILISEAHFTGQPHHFCLSGEVNNILLNPNSTITIMVSFVPQAVGSLRDSLFINNSSSNHPILTIGLYGIGLHVLPKPPEHILISMDSNNTQLSWDAVTENMHHQSIVPDYYFVYNANKPEGEYVLHGLTQNLSYTHPFIALGAKRMFYKVTAVKFYRDDLPPQELDAYLKRNITPGMTEWEIQHTLNELESN